MRANHLVNLNLLLPLSLRVLRRLLDPTGYDLLDGASKMIGNFLGQVCQAQVSLPGNRTAFRVELTVDKLEQGGFTHAIAPKQAHHFPSLNLQAHPVQKGRAAKAEARRLHADQCHKVISSPGGNIL
jgi:hypothetical protein